MWGQVVVALRDDDTTRRRCADANDDPAIFLRREDGTASPARRRSDPPYGIEASRLGWGMDLASHPDGPPPLLYKFLSLAPGQAPSWQDRLAQLMDGRCFHPGAGDFNDPFDCWPYADVPQDDDAGTRRTPFVAAMADVLRRDLPAGYVRDRIQQALASRTAGQIDDAFQTGLRLNADATGVFCLAACIESTLMWSHYGWSHRGIALRFDFRRQPYGGLNPLWKVRYAAKRPVLANLVDPGIDLPRALATKSPVWSYEQEWRSMKPDMAAQVVRFNPEVITGMVFGAGCAPADEALVRAAVAGRGLSLKRMRPNRRTFALDLEPADRKDGDLAEPAV